MLFTTIILVIPVPFLQDFWATLIYMISLLFASLLFQCILNLFASTNINSQELHERRNFPSVTRNAWSMREHYVPHAQVNMSFDTMAEIGGMAIRALPSVKSFDGDETMECPICMDEFQKGELIQSFGACAHDFHISCLNSWLLGGKSTCPVCRLDLIV